MGGTGGEKGEVVRFSKRRDRMVSKSGMESVMSTRLDLGNAIRPLETGE